MQQAELYLLDEPFVGVDNVTEQTVVAILKQLRTEGKTVLVVHHDLQTLTDYFDRALLLNVSRVAYGPVDQVCVPRYVCKAFGKDVFLSGEYE